MSPTAPAWLRVAVIVCGWTVVAAQEQANPDSSAGVALDPIAGAKREFEALKAARESGLHPKSGLPPVQLPDLPSSPAPLIPAVRPATPPREPMPANWLVEAMEKPADRRDTVSGLSNAQRQTRNRPEAAYPETPDALSPGEARERAPSGESGPRRNTEPASRPVAINPLTSFLGEWMTPQDYALLGPGLAAEPGSMSDHKYPIGLDGGGLAVSGRPHEGRGILEAAPLVATRRPENPYLLSTPAVTVKNPSGEFAPPAAIPAQKLSGTPPAGIIPAPETPSRSPTKIPEFARPSTDEKYFKQLKRF